MLSDQEKQQIREQEQFRLDVRSALQPPKSRGQSVMAMLNSPFALWVLSSIVLSLISVIWSSYREEQEADSRMRKLRVEIVHRFYETRACLSLARNGTGAGTAGAVAQLLFEPAQSGEGGSTIISPAFMEFDQWTLNTLLAELGFSNGPTDKKVAADLPKILDQIRKLRAEYEKITLKEQPASGQKLADLLEEGIAVCSKLMEMMSIPQVLIESPSASNVWSS